MITDNCRSFRLFIFFFKTRWRNTHIPCCCHTICFVFFWSFIKGLFIIIIVCTKWILLDMSCSSAPPTSSSPSPPPSWSSSSPCSSAWCPSAAEPSACPGRLVAFLESWTRCPCLSLLAWRQVFFRWGNCFLKTSFFYDWFNWQDTKRLVFLSVIS